MIFLISGFGFGFDVLSSLSLDLHFGLLLRLMTSSFFSFRMQSVMDSKIFSIFAMTLPVCEGSGVLAILGCEFDV